MEPMYASLAFYVSVFALAELSRRLVDMAVPESLFRRFCYEFIATAQMCTCVYENALIVKYYGPWGFLAVVTSLLFLGSLVNRGALVSPLASIEGLVFRRLTPIQFLTLFIAQLLGGYMAFRLARQVWYFAITHDHSAFYQNFYCSIRYKVPYVQAAAYEIIGCFLIRYIVGKTSASSKRYVVAITVASFLTFALVFIGVPGLNPIIASSRMQGCEGLATDWFLFTYWLCPILGWLSAAYHQNRQQTSIPAKKTQ